MSLLSLVNRCGLTAASILSPSKLISGGSLSAASLEPANAVGGGKELVYCWASVKIYVLQLFRVLPH